MWYNKNIKLRGDKNSMIKYKNDCVSCPTEIGCLGSNCPYSHVPYLYCDNCHNEAEELYDVDGDQICEDCLHKMFPKIIINNT